MKATKKQKAEQKLELQDNRNANPQLAHPSTSQLNRTSREEEKKTQAEQSYYHFQYSHIDEQITNSQIIYTKHSRGAYPRL